MTVDVSSIGKTALNRIGINAFILLSDFKNKLVQKFGDFVKCLGYNGNICISFIQ